MGALVLCYLLFVGWGGGRGGASTGAARGCGSGGHGGEAELALEVLQLGNPGLLSAAGLVDGAARTQRGRGELRRMVQLQQTLYCRLVPRAGR